jgi:small conductance mechanosensitive channel
MKMDFLARWADTWVETLLKVLAILVIAWLLRRLLRLVTRRIVRVAEAQTRAAQQHEQQTRTLADLAYSTGSAIIVIGAILTVLPLFGINVTLFAAAAGLASLAVGFGAQHVIRDIFNGFFIVLEDQFVVGDTIRTAGLTGRVEHLTLRRTMLRDAEGGLCVIPNGEIRTLVNLSRDWSQVFVDVSLTGDDAVDQALAALEALCSEFRADPNWSATLVDGPRLLGVETLAAGGATLRVQLRTLPARQHDTARELRRRVRARFEREGIGLGSVHRIEISGFHAQAGGPGGEKA